MGVANARAAERNFVATGSGLPACCADCAMLPNILHAEDAVGVVREAFRVLLLVGEVGVIHWVLAIHWQGSVSP